MSDGQVLNMPARRFWSMNGQIHRIKAADDMRYIQSSMASASKENQEKVLERLNLELGEVVRYERAVMVAPEEGASSRLKALASGKR